MPGNVINLRDFLFGIVSFLPMTNKKPNSPADKMEVKANSEGLTLNDVRYLRTDLPQKRNDETNNLYAISAALYMLMYTFQSGILD